jgi:hypothetical protein
MTCADPGLTGVALAMMACGTVMLYATQEQYCNKRKFHSVKVYIEAVSLKSIS